MLFLGALFVSYWIGSIPFGLLMARLFKAGDIRLQGSGNIGATNVSRVAGFWPAGFLTLVLDISKGVISILLLMPKGFEFWGYGLAETPLSWTSHHFWLIGFFTILGHCFSPFLKFKGGKGVATFYGVLIAHSPLSALVGAVVFGWIFLTRKIGSLASLASVGAVFIAEFVIPDHESTLYLVAMISVLVVLRHSQNIKDLLEDRERSF